MEQKLSKTETGFKILFNEARIAGLLAATECKPQAMAVMQGDRILEVVSGGVCGFAEIIIRPGNCPAANYAKKFLRASKHYYGGMSIWVCEFGQSMEIKGAYGHAFARVLYNAGINSYCQTRMD